VRIEILAQAERDLIAGFRFYEAQQTGLGDYFLDSLYAEIDSLLFFAGRHRIINGYHRLLTRPFPYAVYYRVRGNTVRVWAVVDCRRNPGWVKRKLGGGKKH
jgi:plasmid stabilization system protein ParE